jgi:hypothetical protein
MKYLVVIFKLFLKTREIYSEKENEAHYWQ